MASNRLARAFIVLGVAVALIGCGQEPVTNKNGKSRVTLQAQSSGSASANTGNDTSDADSANNTGSSKSPLKFTIRGTGYSSLSFKVRTGKTLKLRFTPGQQDRKIEKKNGNGELAQYSKLGVQITVNGFTFMTEMLDNGLTSGTPAQSSRIIDFTGRLPETCDSQSAGCRQDVTITIEKPNNDYYCLNSWQYCPWTHVPDKHPWNGVVLVQTDDSGAL